MKSISMMRLDHNSMMQAGSVLLVIFRQAWTTMVALLVVMAVLALVLSWSIKSLIPSPQPVSDVTPVVTMTPPPTLEGAIAETADSAGEYGGI